MPILVQYDHDIDYFTSFRCRRCGVSLEQIEDLAGRIPCHPLMYLETERTSSLSAARVAALTEILLGASHGKTDDRKLLLLL